MPTESQASPVKSGKKDEKPAAGAKPSFKDRIKNNPKLREMTDEEINGYVKWEE